MTENLNIIYRIDDCDRIVYINDDWDIFAIENNAKEMIGGNVKNLWGYIQGREVVFYME